MSAQHKALSIDNVSVAYDGAPVIRDINLHIAAGETFGLIGLNGAGKTTLIKAVLGLRGIAQGQITIFGRPSGDEKGKLDVAYLPERFEPPWFLSGMEFLKFSLRLYGRPADEDRIREAAAMIALDAETLKNRVQTWSKGMRQKLGLLGTILTGCRLLILDEPMSGLDPMARSLTKDLLIRSRAEGRTIFMCSHILGDMEELCDRISVLHEGAIRFTGKPAELKEKTGCTGLERAFLHFIEKKAAA